MAGVRCPNIKNIDAAVRLYYEKFELSSKDIRLIFDTKSTATESKLKNMVREEMAKEGRLPWDSHNVPTDIAFKAWGLEIADLERRRAKLVKLGLIQEKQKTVDIGQDGEPAAETEVANV